MPQLQSPAPTTSAPETEEVGTQVQTSGPMSESGGLPNAREATDGVAVDDQTVDAAAYNTALDDPNVTADQLVAMASRLARFNIAEAAAVYSDGAAMAKVISRLGSEQITMVVLYWRVPFVDAIKHVAAKGPIAIGDFARLVSGRTAEMCVAALADDTAWAAIHAMTVDDPVGLFPLLQLNPPKLIEALAARPEYLAWCVEKLTWTRLGEILDRLGEFEADSQLRAQMKLLGTYDTQLSLHPKPTTDAREQRKLYNWLLSATDIGEAKNLFEARYDWSLDDAGGSWDLASVLRVWQICGRLPPGQILEGITFAREGDAAGAQASGWAQGDTAMGATWGSDVMETETESGDYADDADPMRGLNVFDATIRHEIGHTVGARTGADANGGWVCTTFGWSTHDDFGALVDTLVGLMPLSAPLSPDVQTAITAGIKAADGTFTEANFLAKIEKAGDDAGIADLDATADGEDLLDYLVGRSADGAWNTPGDVGGNSYHVDYAPNGDFVSYPSALWGRKVSTYAMRSPAEWFAECYATFYAEADQPNVAVGRLLQGRDPAAYQAFLTNVHGGFNLGSMTGQEMGHASMGV